MHKRACPDVITQGGLTDDITDKKLVKSLLNTKRMDTLNQGHPVFEIYNPEDDESEVEDSIEADPEPVAEVEVPEVEKPKDVKPPAKKKAARKKAVRTRNKPAA